MAVAPAAEIEKSAVEKAKEQKAGFKELVKGLQKGPEVGQFEDKLRKQKEEEEKSKDPGPITTDFGLLSVEELIKQGRPSVTNCEISPSLKISMSILSQEEKILIGKLIDKDDPRNVDPDHLNEAQRVAWLAISISKINATEFPTVTGLDGKLDLTEKKKLYNYLWQFPASAIGLLWMKYYELDEQNPFLNPTSKKKS